MRWDNLRIDGEQEKNLPGYRDPAQVRRFDAPGGPEHEFLRGQGEVSAQPSAEGIAHAVPLDDQSVQGMHP